MKLKTKLIPILTIGATVGAVIPVAVSCNSGKTELIPDTVTTHWDETSKNKLLSNPKTVDTKHLYTIEFNMGDWETTLPQSGYKFQMSGGGDTKNIENQCVKKNGTPTTVLWDKDEFRIYVEIVKTDVLTVELSFKTQPTGDITFQLQEE